MGHIIKPQNGPLGDFTLTGNLIFGENTSIVQQNLLNNNSYSGLIINGVAGTSLVFGNLIYLDSTSSRWKLTDGNNIFNEEGDSTGIVGICISNNKINGDAIVILLNGIIRADSIFPTLTINSPVYISETPGYITVTQPSTANVIIRVIGFGLSSNLLYFNPSNDYVTHI